MAYSTINKPSDYFNSVLYTGSGSTPQSITGVGFQPDFVWLKCRSTSGTHHIANDVVRGTKACVFPNLINAELTRGVSSFDADGFSFDDNAGGDGNETGRSHVAWNWLGGGTAVSNTDGSITSSISANTTAGFSVGTYTGNSTASTIGHGLNSAPEVIMVKNRSSGTRNWAVYHKDLTGTNKYLRLNTTDAEQTDSSTWNNTAPTSSVWSVAASGETNQNTENFVFYAFHSVKGYSKMGFYYGNGVADGAMVYTGFRPAWVLINRINTTAGWVQFDNKREPFNVADTSIRVDDSGAENESNGAIDFLSNGFKLRTTDGGVNGNFDPHIYMAFAERSLVGTNNIPALAR